MREELPHKGRAASPSYRFARFVMRWHRLLLLILALLTGLAAWRATRLALRTEFAELLPTNDPATIALKEMERRLPALSSIVVVVQSPSPDANRRFVDDLVPRLLRLQLPALAGLSFGVKEEEAFFRQNKFMYVSLGALQHARDRLQREILKRKSPLYVDLEDETGPKLDRRLLDQKTKELSGRYPGGYYATQDRKAYAVVAWVKGSTVHAGAGGSAVAEAVRSTVARLSPSHYHPSMTVGLTGSIITSLEERAALENDLVVATSVCVSLVCLAIFAFYGRLSAVPFAAIPALSAVLMALAFAQAAFGYLNSSTAFMGAIIVGNGINYGIVLMARYEEERRRGRPVQTAIARALRGTWRPTAIAALGAAIAYGSLAITSFRGFSQFGYIGGVGMILAWIITMVGLPSLWALFDRRGRRPLQSRLRGFALIAPLARFAVRRPAWLLIVGVAVTGLAVLPLPGYARDPFEYNFARLRNQRSRYSETEQLSSKLDQIFGRTLSPNFVLARSVSEVEEIRSRMRERDQRYQVLGQVKTIHDYLPGTLKVQKEKLRVLSQVRKLIDSNLALLEPEQRADLLAVRPPDDLRVLEPADLPSNVRRNFTEVDGTVGRVVVYYPRRDVSVWDGRVQIRLAAVVQQLHLSDGSTIRSSGPAIIFAAMINAIRHDGPIVTAAAFVGVSLLVLLAVQSWLGAGLILGALLLGVLWMLGGTAAAGVRINFLNFIALPITFGIGVDYAVNLWQRYRQEGRGRVEPVVTATGAAVALCSLTTIIGYGALLVADNYALRSFGEIAILGEFACIAAALVVLPAVLRLLEIGLSRAAILRRAPEQSPVEGRAGG